MDTPIKLVIDNIINALADRDYVLFDTQIIDTDSIKKNGYIINVTNINTTDIDNIRADMIEGLIGLTADVNIDIITHIGNKNILHYLISTINALESIVKGALMIDYRNETGNIISVKLDSINQEVKDGYIISKIIIKVDYVISKIM